MEKTSSRRTLINVISAICLIIIICLVAFLITASFLKPLSVNIDRNLNFPKDAPEYSEVDRLPLEDKRVIISRPTGKHRCYLLPWKADAQESDLPRALIIIDEPLTNAMLEPLVGEKGVAFCNGYGTYLARELKTDDTPRQKRDGNATSAGPAAAGASDLFASAQDPGKPAQEVPIDQREPRCNAVILDCVDHVGQVQNCYTWVNGVLWMDRKCTDSKQFVVHVTKPPGRILKIAQQQWVICLERRKQGLKC